MYRDGCILTYLDINRGKKKRHLNGQMKIDFNMRWYKNV